MDKEKVKAAFKESILFRKAAFEKFSERLNKLPFKEAQDILSGLKVVSPEELEKKIVAGEMPLSNLDSAIPEEKPFEEQTDEDKSEDDKKLEDDMSEKVDKTPEDGESDKENLSETADKAKEDEDDLSETADKAKEDEDNLSETADKAKEDEDDLSETVDKAKEDEDNLSETADKAKEDEDKDKKTLEERVTELEALKDEEEVTMSEQGSEDTSGQDTTVVDADAKTDKEKQIPSADETKADLEDELSDDEMPVAPSIAENADMKTTLKEAKAKVSGETFKELFKKGL